MSKVVLGSVALGLNGAVIAGGGWLIHTGLQKGDAGETTPAAELPKALANFKEQETEKPCLGSLFPGLTNTKGETQDTSSTADNFFDTSKKTEGCLVVNWDKENSTKENETNKWKGNFRFLWAVKSETKGFAVFLVGKTPESGEGKEIQWEGIIYTLEATTSGKSTTWTAKKRSEVNSGSKTFKKSGDSVQTNQFPQPGTAVAETDTNAISDFWGWFNPTSDLENIASSFGDGVTTPNKTSFRGYWDWEGPAGEGDQSKKTLADWTKDLDTWWNAIFGSDFHQVKTLSEKHKGTWTNRVRKPEVKSSAQA